MRECGTRVSILFLQAERGGRHRVGRAPAVGVDREYIHFLSFLPSRELNVDLSDCEQEGISALGCGGVCMRKDYGLLCKLIYFMP